MTREQIIEAFRVQMMQMEDNGLHHHVSYIARRPLTPFDARQITPGERSDRMAISVRLAVYDVDAMLEEFKDHVFVGFHDSFTNDLPIIEKIELLIA